MEATEMFINRKKKKKDTENTYTHTHTHTHNGIFLSHKKYQNCTFTDMCMGLENVIQSPVFSEMSKREK